MRMLLFVHMQKVPDCINFYENDQMQVSFVILLSIKFLSRWFQIFNLRSYLLLLYLNKFELIIKQIKT